MRWIERHRHLLDYTLASLFRRRWRLLALMPVFTLTVFVAASAVFLGTALRREALSLLENAPDIVVQRIVAGRQVFIPVSHGDPLSAIRGIRSVRPRLWGYYLNPVNGSSYTLMVPPDFSHADHEIVVGEGVMRTWGAVEGRRLFFTTHARESLLLDAVASLKADTGLVSSDLILLSEAAFRGITGLPRGFAADIVLTVNNPRETKTVARKVMRALPDTLPILKEEIRRAYEAVFYWRSGILLVLFSGAFLAFLILAWERAAGISGEERMEIGILKAVGWDVSDILAVKFWEGAVISLTAFLFGTILAYGHVFLLSAPLFAPVLRGWSVLYPRVELVAAVDGGDIALLFGISVVPYILLTLVPAWRTATLPPDAALRSG